MANNWYALRWKILNRDRFACRYCGQSAPDVVLHIDHMTPKAEGGTDDERNLITACSACNIGKHLDRLRIIPPEAKTSRREGLTIVRQRKIPKLTPLMLEYLMAHGPATAKEIVAAVTSGKSYQNVSEKLRLTGLFQVVGQRGREFVYAVKGDPDPVKVKRYV